MKKIKQFKQFNESESLEDKKAVMVKAIEQPSSSSPSIFLAGSIEMGKAVDWQQKIYEILKNEDVVLLNPRRDDWDSSLKQTIEEKQFRDQVEWELNSMENCSVIIMNFDPETKSPVTLLELGLHARSGKLLVCCPEGFFRKGNVDVTCAKYGVPMFNTIEELAAAAIIKIKS